jgi:hypothetical protein
MHKTHVNSAKTDSMGDFLSKFEIKQKDVDF